MMKRLGWVSFTVGVAWALAGCATMTGTVRERAAADSRCVEENVQVEELAGSAFRATCGQWRATYGCERMRDSSVVCRREPGA